MVGQQVLALLIGVQIPVPEQIDKNTTSVVFLLYETRYYQKNNHQ